MMNGKGFGRTHSSPNQAIAKFVRMYVYLFTFFIFNHILFYFRSLFSLALQFLVPFFGFQLHLTAQFPSSNLRVITTPTAVYPPCTFVTHIISTIPMEHTVSFPRGSSSLTTLSRRRKHYGLSKRLELLTQRHGVTSRTT